MEIKKVPKKIYKILVKKLKEYKYMQDEILDIETQKSSSDINSSYRSKYNASDSVAKFAIKLAEDQNYQELKAWRKCIDYLLVMYINYPAKLKFLQRRYIECELVHFEAPKKYKLKDKYVIADLELEGYIYSDITWKRWKYEMIYNLYCMIKNNKYLKKYTNFNK